MIIKEAKLPYSALDKQVDLAGNREFYRLDYGQYEDTITWDSGFVKTLDKFLANSVPLTKSEARAVNEWLDHEDAFMRPQKPSTHEQRVLESLDAHFLATTLSRGY